MAKAKRAPARGNGASARKSVRQEYAAPKTKHKGGPVVGTPSPMRTRLSPELQAYARRLYEETDQHVTEIAADCGVNESVIRRMGPRAQPGFLCQTRG